MVLVLIGWPSVFPLDYLKNKKRIYMNFLQEVCFGQGTIILHAL